MVERFNVERQSRRGQANFASVEVPKLRIGFIEKRDYFDFKIDGTFSVYNDLGYAILSGVSSPIQWRIRAEDRQPAKYNYNILVGVFTKREKAAEQEYQLLEKGIGARIQKIGGKVFIKSKLINDNSKYWVLIDQLASEDEALEFAA
ncbi:MAG: hypothetical protein SCK70_17615, partial [bacterium]|nr:hypothetical protein [bacterium]